MSLEAFQHAVLEALRVSDGNVLAETVMDTIDLYADPDNTVMLCSTWYVNGVGIRAGVDEERVPIRYAGGGGMVRITGEDVTDGPYRRVYHAELMGAGMRAPVPLEPEVARALSAWAFMRSLGPQRCQVVETEVRM